MAEEAPPGGGGATDVPAEPAPAAPEGGDTKASANTAQGEPGTAAASGEGQDQPGGQGAGEQPTAEDGQEPAGAGDGATAENQETAAGDDTAAGTGADGDKADSSDGTDAGQQDDASQQGAAAEGEDPAAEGAEGARPADGQDGQKSDFATAVDSIAQPPDPPDRLHEIADSLRGVGDDTQPARDEADRFAKATNADWPDPGGDDARARSAASATEVDETAANARAVSEYASASAAEIDKARQDGQAITAQYEAEDAKAQALLSTDEEREPFRQRFIREAANENQQRYATAADKVRQAAPQLEPVGNSQRSPAQFGDDDGDGGFDFFDWLDPTREDPARDWVVDGTNRTSERILTVEPEGPDAGVTAKGPGSDGTIASLDAHAHLDHGKWRSFDSTGKYSFGLDASAQLNRPSSEDPLIQAELNAGWKANLDEITLLDEGPVKASITPEVRAGPGVEVEFDPSLENGKLELNGKFSGSPLFGGGLGFNTEFDLNELANSVDSIRRGIFG